MDLLEVDVGKRGAWTFMLGGLPFRAQMFRMARRLTRSVEGAQLLIEYTWFRAYRVYGTFRSGMNLKVWLHKILKKTFRNQDRRRTQVAPQMAFAHTEETVESRLVGNDPGATRTPEKELMESSFDSEVGRSLVALPHNYKMVVMLADIEGHSYREIADILAIPVGTVMSRLFCGRLRLERALHSFGAR